MPRNQSIGASITGIAVCLAAVLALNITVGQSDWARAQERSNPGESVEEGRPAGSGGGTEATDPARPVQIFTDARGRSCRVYARTVTIEGVPKTALATICREPNGRWVLSR